jgi:hypothetical protein
MERVQYKCIFPPASLYILSRFPSHSHLAHSLANLQSLPKGGYPLPPLPANLPPPAPLPPAPLPPLPLPPPCLLATLSGLGSAPLDPADPPLAEEEEGGEEEGTEEGAEKGGPEEEESWEEYVTGSSGCLATCPGLRSWIHAE